ncbi:hypothetical protein V2J09_004786 [Rumex salicifolius]
MGCASSKKIGATSPTTKSTALDIYRPSPSGFAVFDINSIEEPWLKLESALQFETPFRKPSLVPAPLLEKLNDDDVAPPQSWDEISKALHDFKTQPTPPPPAAAAPPEPAASSTIRTAQEIEKKPEPGLKKLKPVRFEDEAPNPVRFGGESEGFRSLRDNPFILKDKIESEKEGKESFLERLKLLRQDPLGGFPEKCPPGGTGGVVLYTTSLGGVRKTFEECNRARSILELHRVVFDERDVSLHGEFRNESRELVGDSAAVPRLFIHGRYIGGLDELLELNETGRLVRILSWARVERGVGWKGCEGCGGARFVPCMDCGGSCKVVVAGQRERCSSCNENGLTPCPLCH